MVTPAQFKHRGQAGKLLAKRLATPADFHIVSQCYRRFGQTSDAEMQGLLAIGWRDAPTRAAGEHARTERR